MDLNHLLFRHQISLMRADRATSADERLEQGRLAAGYAERIGALQPGLLSTSACGAC